MLTRFTLAALLLATPAFAQEAITLSGDGIAATELTAEALAALPQVTQDVTYLSSGEERSVTYTGAMLWPILEAAGLLEGIDRNSELSRYVAVTAAGDDYTIVFSIGELHPDFGNAPIMIATAQDGAAVPEEDGFRLVVPGDSRGARYVHGITEIVVH